jgi:N-acetylglucosaminyl-diphospho-decaprenol L-rhamnosyltransferase
VSEPRVVAVVATYRRPSELGRLLTSLEQSHVPFHGIVVTDNASDAATAEVVGRTSIQHRLVQPGENLGCGGGLRRAEETVLREFPDFTHIFVLDDDAVVPPETLGGLLEGAKKMNTGVACPIVHDAEGQIGWFPGLLKRRSLKALSRVGTPANYLAQIGPSLEYFTWGTGVAMLVSRGTLERVGLHRDDFWMRGEDLDFALRVTWSPRGVFVPTVSVAHLPPGGVVNNFAERMKDAAMIQNCTFLITRTRHGKGIAKFWPVNAWRHLKRFGLRSIFDLVRAVWLGGVRGRPAGVPGGEYFRQRLARGK